MSPKIHTPRISRKATQSLLCAMAGIGAASSAQAANQTWKGTPTDATWATTTNWVSGAVPGIVYTANTTNTTDIATFNATQTTTVGTSANPITIETNRMIGGLTFDTANASSYFIGAATGSPILTFGNNLTTQITSTVVNPQTINAPIALHLPSSTNGAYTVKNDSATSSAILTLAGGIVNSPNSTRGTAWTLSGTNTGDNTVSGVINISNSGGIASTVTKTGTGRWVLANANTIGGGVIINGGTLAASNAGALGTVSPIVNTGGTLEVKNVALNNTSVTLNDGGTIIGNGSAESVKVANVSATASGVTLSTVGSGDVFTVGVASNGYTGGQASTITNITGPGVILLGQSNNYAGSWSINSGTLRTGNASALGSSGGVAFGSGSTGKLQLNGSNLSASALTTNATVGTPVVENGGSSNSTLTVNTTSANTYAGTIQDGSTGLLALAKSGTGSLSLTGSNTYTGGTTISGGTLKANNSTGSATGSGSVTVANGGTLGGSGTISGAVNVQFGGIVAPGNSVGTLTVGSLTADSGSIFNFEFNATPANDKINVSNSGGLTLNGGGFNLYSEGTTNAWTTTGSYNLIQYAGSIQGTGTGALSVLNPQAGYGYTFGSSGGFVTLDVAISALISHWNVDSGGSWATAGNWGNGVPNGSGQGAILDKALTSPATVTLDGNKTVGGFTLDSANGYTIAAGTGGTLSLDSGASQASVIVTSGSHSITAPVALASNTVASVASGAALSASGGISGSGSLTKSGSGSLDLDSSNSYSGGTSVTGGTLNFVAGGLGSGNVSMNGATLAYKGSNTDDLSTRTFTIGASGATLNVGANNVTFANGIGNSGSGSLTKSGSGTLTLSGNNTYTGSTVVSQGGLILSGTNASTGGTFLTGANTSLAIASDASLGAAPGAATTNLTFAPGAGNTATLTTNAAMTINANRTVALSSGTAVIDTNGNNVTLGGALTGSGNFAKSGAGTLTLGSTAVAATGTLAVNGGALSAPTTAYFPTGAISLNNAALNITTTAAQSVGNLTINGNSTIGSGSTGIFGVGTIVGGSGNLTINGGSFVNDLTGSWSGFTGSITLGGTGGYRINGATGSASVAFDLGSKGVSVRSSATAITFGALSGASGSTLSGSAGGVTQAVTYTIGGLGTNTTFAGSITDGAAATSLTKVGVGSLTLSGASTYSGATTISNGTIALGANNALSANSDISIASATSSLDLSTFSSSAKSLTVSNGATVKFNLSSGGINNATALLALTNGLNEAVDGGSYTVDFGSFIFDTAGSYKLFSFSSISGTLAVTDFVAANSTLSGVTGGFVLNGNDLSYVLTSAVPEPSAFAMFAGVAGLGAAGLRRRRRAAA